jgi:hypothetical protein
MNIIDFNISFILTVVFIGCFATVVMDLWALFLKRAFSIPSLNYCFVGRWLRHMPEGSFTHTSIASAASKPAECLSGWVAHYAIGIAFSTVLLLITSSAWLQQPTLAPALLFGVATVAIPFFIMQPALGLGIAAAKAPQPMQARGRSLMAHAVFGVGIYLGALVLSLFWEAHF